jgi:hypothetical protein
MKMMGHHGGRDNKPTIPLAVTIPRLFEYMIRHKNPLIVALIGILTGSGLGLLMPQITRYTIDVIIPQGITSRICIPIVSLLGLTVGLAIATFVQQRRLRIGEIRRLQSYEHERKHGCGESVGDVQAHDQPLDQPWHGHRCSNRKRTEP